MINPIFHPSRLMFAALRLAVVFLFVSSACAQGVGVGPEFFDVTRRWLDSALASNRPSGLAPLRMEVSVGELDSRLRLAPCSRVEPFVPVGTRLWGKTRLGVRCLDGAVKWSVFLPVTVKAYGLAWVIKGNVASGAVLTESDAMETEVDWAEDASPVVAMPSQWVGQVAARALTTGQAVRQAMIRPAQVFQAGAQVRVVAQGLDSRYHLTGKPCQPGLWGSWHASKWTTDG